MHNINLKIFLLFFILALSNACATQSALLNNKTQQQQIENLQSWLTRGKVSFNVADKQQSARLYWHQNADNFHIQLSGPVGFGRIVLKGNAHAVNVKSSNNEQSFNNIASALAFYQLPPLAITHLRYWLIGIPSPTQEMNSLPASHLEYNTALLLSSFQQAGWSIRYLSYSDKNTLLLPEHVRLENAHYSIDFKLYTWELIASD